MLYNGWSKVHSGEIATTGTVTAKFWNEISRILALKFDGFSQISLILPKFEGFFQILGHAVA